MEYPLAPARLPQVSRLLAVCFGGLVPLAAQGFRTHDVVGYQTAAYDALRGRLTVLGPKNETFDYDGVARLSGPRLRSLAPARLAFEAHTAGMLAVLGTTTGALQTARREALEWRVLQPATSPSGRHLFGLTYDPLRAETLLFGGFNANNSTLDETWVFDGMTWTQRLPAVSPSARRGVALTFDSTRGVALLFGGYGTAALGDTWLWDGSNWTLQQPATSPAGRQGAAMGFDPIRDRAVLYGGNNGAGFWYSQTWEYDGQTWSLRTNMPTGPLFREQSALVWNADAGRCEMVGGVTAGGFLFDRWQWDGTVWHSIVRSASPSDRRIVSAHPGGGSAVVVDMTNPSTTWQFDESGWQALPIAAPVLRSNPDPIACTGPTAMYVLEGTDPMTLHEFDGSSWRVASSSGPPLRQNCAMAVDWANSEVVVFGGGDATVGELDETWTFDGVTWTQRMPATRPSPREYPAMTFDITRQRLILTGGWNQVAWQADTWEWDGNSWAMLAVGPAPQSDSVVALEYDATRGETVAVTTRRLDSTLRLSALGPNGWAPVGNGIELGRNLFDIRGFVGLPYPRGVLAVDSLGVHSMSSNTGEAVGYGAACTSTAPQLAAREWPRLGRLEFGIDVVGGPANGLVALLGADRPGSGGTIGNCPLLVASGQAALLLVTSAEGFATAPVALPELLGFVGVDLHFQAAMLDVAAPSGFTFSSGLRVTLGH